MKHWNWEHTEGISVSEFYWLLDGVFVYSKPHTWILLLQDIEALVGTHKLGISQPARYGDKRSGMVSLGMVDKQIVYCVQLVICQLRDCVYE